MGTRLCCGCQSTDRLMLIMQLLNYSVKSSTLGGNNNDNGVFSGVTKYTAISLPVPARPCISKHLGTVTREDILRVSVIF